MSIGGLYTVSFEDVAVTVVQDLFEVTVPADKQYVIHEVRVSQSSDAGDSESEQLLFKLKRHWNGQTSGSGGSSATPAALNGRDRTATAPTGWEVNNTTQVSGGSSALTYVSAEDVQVGLSYVPKTGCEPIIVEGETFTVSLENEPDDSLTMSGVVVFQVQAAAAHR